MTSTPALHRLPQVAILRLRGVDARSFLQGQLTQDVTRLSREVSAIGAYCTPQGRVLAVPRLVLADESVLAVLPRDLATATAERLRKFVLRARLSIEVTQELEAYGCAAPDDAALRAAVPSCPADADAVAHVDGRILVRLAGARALALAPPGSGREPADDDLAAWECAAIAHGEPTVGRTTAERWIPQMLNLDLVGAVSFAKGCYPGQEIVARTQHLGRIKRRMLRYAAAGRPAVSPGDDLHDGSVKAGEIVRTAHAGTRTELLAVVGVDHAGMPLLTAAGDRFDPQPLPYVVPEALIR